jgi:uncharacterized protein YukE
MIEMMGVAAVSAELEVARRELRAVATRLERVAAEAPHRSSGNWHGLAAEAYAAAVGGLTREIGAGQELLRSATDLLSAALYELGGHG